MPSSSILLRSPRILIAFLAVSYFAGCKVPEDPDRTTQEVSAGTLKIGALMEPLDDVETRAVARIADAFQTEADILTGDPHSLFALLEEGKLHIVAGRIPSNTPFAPQCRAEGSDWTGHHQR